MIMAGLRPLPPGQSGLTTLRNSDGILRLQIGDAPLRSEAAKAYRNQQRRFIYARNAETWYSIQLRKISQQIGALTEHLYDPVAPMATTILEDALRAYSKIIAPWARNVATKMIADVARRDYKAWRERSREIGAGLAEEIANAPTGEVMRALLDEQVDLITSLPLDAAKRVQELALNSISESTRGENIVELIMRTGLVSKNHATLIARTETARTAAVLTEARAKHVGSDGYIWRTARDRDVRPLHRKLEGKFCYWNDPPISGEQGERSHPGCIYNCRCWPEVILPERN